MKNLAHASKNRISADMGCLKSFRLILTIPAAFLISPEPKEKKATPSGRSISSPFSPGPARTVLTQMKSRMPIESIALFPNPNTPDLGCFVRRKHGFERGFRNIHVEFNPSVDFSPAYHQTPDTSVPPPVLQNFPPDWVLGGEYTPRPSDWYRYPTQSGERFYWFFGQNRNPAGAAWQADARVGHSYDIYENGTLSTVRYDDAGGDLDFNDLVLEIAIVGRRSWIDLIQAENQGAFSKEFERDGLPLLRERLKRGDEEKPA